MKPIRIIIAGGRDFCNKKLRPLYIEVDFDLLFVMCDRYLQNLNPNEVEIVSGGCMGADLAGESYATIRGLSIKRW